MPDTQQPEHIETRFERRARKRLERKQGSPRKKVPVSIYGAIFGVLAVVGIWWLLQANTAPKDPDAVAAEHKKLLDRCTTDMATVYHIHPHIRVIINGEETTLSTNIGIDNACMHSLHTHDNTGIIHVESPKKEDFTLADLFYIWKKEYTESKILDQSVTTETQLKLFVNGKETASGPKTVMQDKTSYVIMYGPANTELKPPANYTFPDSL